MVMLPSKIARRWVGRQALRWTRHKAIQFSWLGPEILVCCLAHRGSTGVFLLLRVSVSYSATIIGQLTESAESSFLIHQGCYHDLFDVFDDSWTS